ncbi:hypothetical protein B0H13DRAFT_1862618 [Mycena leptocephala]|nr:hypothetical protein B0H13DRAFT_1862618 [Mycena leptocephala]
MRFTISLLAAVVLAIQANAQQIIAFSGDTCNGGQGGEVPCDGTCFDFTGRHSYEIFSSTASVSLFSGSDCTGQEFPFGPDPLASASMSTQGPHQHVQLHPGLSAEDLSAKLSAESAQRCPRSLAPRAAVSELLSHHPYHVLELFLTTQVVLTVLPLTPSVAATADLRLLADRTSTFRGSIGTVVLLLQRSTVLAAAALLLAPLLWFSHGPDSCVHRSVVSGLGCLAIHAAVFCKKSYHFASSALGTHSDRVSVIVWSGLHRARSMLARDDDHCVVVEVHPHVETGHGVFGTAIYFTEMHVLPA